MITIFWNTKRIRIIYNFLDRDILDGIHFVNHILIQISDFLDIHMAISQNKNLHFT
jgi:imidazoleglycerol phosphate dehydratase HisB